MSTVTAEELLNEYTRFLHDNKLDPGVVSHSKVVGDFIKKSRPALADIRANLDILPTKIAEVERECLKMSGRIAEIGAFLKSNENATALAVMREKDDGKPRYSNDAKRKAETERRLKDDKTHQSNTEELLSTKAKLADTEITKSFLSRIFRAAEAHTRIGFD